MAQNIPSRTLLTAGIVLAMALTFGCSLGDDVHKTSIIYGPPVTYKGETYQTVKIGNQTWMAENLNYAAPGSKCYDNKESYCDTYGRLYDWSTALTVCPSGWHLPSDDDWTTLANYVGASTLSKRLMATSGWNEGGNGTDEYGFAALPGGNGYSEGYFNIGLYGYWWSAREFNADNAGALFMSYYGYVRSINFKSFLFSVRCVQD